MRRWISFQEATELHMGRSNRCSLIWAAMVQSVSIPGGTLNVVSVFCSRLRFALDLQPCGMTQKTKQFIIYENGGQRWLWSRSSAGQCVNVCLSSWWWHCVEKHLLLVCNCVCECVNVSCVKASIMSFNRVPVRPDLKCSSKRLLIRILQCLSGFMLFHLSLNLFF